MRILSNIELILANRDPMEIITQIELHLTMSESG